MRTPGLCRDAFDCLTNTQGKTADCIGEHCGSKYPTPLVNDLLTCMADCNPHRFFTKGFSEAVDCDGGSSGSGGSGGSTSGPTYWADDWGEACKVCMEKTCPAANLACGDIHGNGACADAYAYIIEDWKKNTPSDCAAVRSVGQYPTPAVNDIVVCMGECQPDCFFRKGLSGCDA